MAAVLDAALAEKVNLTAISLGMLVKDVWEGKVKRQKKDHGSRFSNLKKRTIEGMRRNDHIIHELNTQLLKTSVYSVVIDLVGFLTPPSSP